MVFFLTGVPGSGKTYYLVHYSEENINKTDKKTGSKLYQQVVHNISGYKNGLYVDFGDEYLPKIIQLNKYYQTIKKDVDKDDLLIEKARQLGIYKILLIVDEAHLYFVNDYSEKGKESYYALLWFISYHRHLYSDIVLATQNLTLVDYKFKGFAEFFVKAVPSSLRFSLNPFANKFTYYYYPDSKMWNEARYKTEKLPVDKKIFELYTSGDSVKKQKVYLYTLGIILFFILAGLFLWFIFKRSLLSHGHPVDSVVNSVKSDNNISHSVDSPVTHVKLGKTSTVPRDSLNRDLANEDLSFDVVHCSVLSGTCNSYLTPHEIHYRLFSKLVNLNLLETFHKESQYGIITYYVILHISKDAYLQKYLIRRDNSDPPRASKKRGFDIDYNSIKSKYRDSFDHVSHSHKSLDDK